MAAPGMFNSGFLSEKTGGFPNWSIGVGAIAALVLLKTWQKNKAESITKTGPSTTTPTASNYVTPGTSATNTGAPTVFVVPGATPSAPSQPPLIGRTPDTTQLPSAPGNLHINRGLGSAIPTWDADTQSDYYTVDVFAPSTGKTYTQTVPGPKRVLTTGSPLSIVDSGIKRTVTVTGHNAAGAGPSATASFTS